MTKAGPGTGAMAGWRGVRMRTLRIGADAEAPMRSVTVPADWNDEAAAALARLAPGSGATSLAAAAAAWIEPLAGADGDRAGGDQAGGNQAKGDQTEGGGRLGRLLADLLLRRALAPAETVWQGGAGWQGEAGGAGFVVNLAGFVRPGGFETAAFVKALEAAAEALRRLRCAEAGILLGNLDAALAGLGLDYDSDAARDCAACLAALASATVHPDAVPSHGLATTPPERCASAALARAAASAWNRARATAQAGDRLETGDMFPEDGAARAGLIRTGFSTPGPVDALLGFEACGAAPVFSPLSPDGRLAPSTLARLAARGMSAESALAASLAGRPVLRAAGPVAAEAMRRAVLAFVDRVPAPLPAQAPPPSGAGAPHRNAGLRRALPARHGGFTQRSAIDGHRIYLRTGEYADGSLGELSIAVRESRARGLMDAFGEAVSIGLQHGVPLQAFVEAFAYSSFGPHGTVEGDAAIGTASSLLDYAFRSLAKAYLGRELDDPPPRHAEGAGPNSETLLPLDLPAAGPRPERAGVRQRHGLRLVG